MEEIITAMPIPIFVLELLYTKSNMVNTIIPTYVIVLHSGSCLSNHPCKAEIIIINNKISTKHNSITIYIVFLLKSLYILFPVH